MNDDLKALVKRVTDGGAWHVRPCADSQGDCTCGLPKLIRAVEDHECGDGTLQVLAMADRRNEEMDRADRLAKELDEAQRGCASLRLELEAARAENARLREALKNAAASMASAGHVLEVDSGSAYAAVGEAR